MLFIYTKIDTHKKNNDTPVSNPIAEKTEGIETCHPNVHVTVYFASYHVQEEKMNQRCAHKKRGL